MNRTRKEPAATGGPPTLTRRQLLAGAAVAAVAAGIPSALAGSPPTKMQRARTRTTRSDLPLRRYMAASALLGDGRILVMGGYDRPWSGEGPAPTPLRSAAIYDPNTGKWRSAAPMGTPRARHAAVALEDGRVAVMGGMSMNATASVEFYDPVANAWSAGSPLAQPRYDHSAVSDGPRIYVLGGSGQIMLSSIEVLDPNAPVQFTGR